MPSNETQDDGENEDIQEFVEAAFAASSQGTSLPASPRLLRLNSGSKMAIN
jgi:hypothetical protein